MLLILDFICCGYYFDSICILFICMIIICMLDYLMFCVMFGLRRWCVTIRPSLKRTFIWIWMCDCRNRRNLPSLDYTEIHKTDKKVLKTMVFYEGENR